MKLGKELSDTIHNANYLHADVDSFVMKFVPIEIRQFPLTDIFKKIKIKLDDIEIREIKF